MHAGRQFYIHVADTTLLGRQWGRCSGYGSCGSAQDHNSPTASNLCAAPGCQAQSNALAMKPAARFSTSRVFSRWGTWPQAVRIAMRAGPETPSVMRRGNSLEPYSSASPCMAKTGQRTSARYRSSDQAANFGASQVSVHAAKTQPALLPWYLVSLANYCGSTKAACAFRIPARVRGSANAWTASVMTTLQHLGCKAAMVSAMAPPTDSTNTVSVEQAGRYIQRLHKNRKIQLGFFKDEVARRRSSPWS